MAETLSAKSERADEADSSRVTKGEGMLGKIAMKVKFRCCFFWGMGVFFLLLLLFVGGALAQPFLLRNAIFGEARSQLHLESVECEKLSQSVEPFIFGPSGYACLIRLKTSWKLPDSMRRIREAEACRHLLDRSARSTGISFNPSDARCYWALYRKGTRQGELAIVYDGKQSLLWIHVWI